ncbi:hypothetical protein RB213_007690, partial [Colletotrichum asianum]
FSCSHTNYRFRDSEAVRLLLSNSPNLGSNRARTSDQPMMNCKVRRRMHWRVGRDRLSHLTELGPGCICSDGIVPQL